MSSESEEENFCFLGKPLQPYDEDAFPKKKPITIEEQVATDEHGRRRFHGAFTGGFSAGFYNTVGSLEGWTPSEFKSTRQDKAQNLRQRPEDFMDDEDIGEYGIAPQTVKATKEYNTSKKRHRKAFADGPIPGEPVLHTLLTSGNETVGYLLLKNIGVQDKISINSTEQQGESLRTYGCEIPKTVEISTAKTKQYEIPAIYREFLTTPKANSFGLGYTGLDRSHINLFQSSNLVIRGKNNEKMTISGRAFGVGAFEEEDEDIYMKEDMSKYDFELTREKKKLKDTSGAANLIFDLFVKSKTPLVVKKVYPPPSIPHSFTGKHKVKKSRFEPIVEETPSTSRKDITPAVRAKYLGEPENESVTESQPILPTQQVVKPKKPEPKKEEPKSKPDLATSLMFDRFVSASKPENASDILAPVERSETTHGTEEMRGAARMKMFGPLTRITSDFYPCPLLCKRFNVPEPLLDKSELQRDRKRTKNLIFEYQKHAENNADLKPGVSMMKQDPETPEIEESDTNQKQNDEEAVKEEDAPPIEDPPKDITDKLDVDKNIDLFKAVFLSSSESESDEEDSKEEGKKKEEEMKANVLSEEFLPKIKPLKEGIL
ncbi:unnamed protein product [Brassicogethes aeneus]|uniref:G patch domain-containing protein n=1 Tax=Brassicogethes aeneus TaxID=1431903 RepID=A0A9P0AQP9_BRAAE|nr:unnamed protein product [Brassicogethes aeneus]